MEYTLDGVTPPLTLVPVPAASSAGAAPAAPDTVWIADAGYAAALRVRTRAELLAAERAAAGRAEGAADPVLRSPMPGTVTAVAAADGDRVTAGQPLLSVEAMKMEHQLTAPASGVVSLNLQPGDLVRADQVLAVVTPETEPPGSEIPDAEPIDTETQATPS